MKKLVALVMIIVALAMESGAAGDIKTYSAKSEQAASNMSVFGHFVPLILGLGAFSAGASQESANGGLVAAGIFGIATGTVVGPGMGHLYAGNKGRFWRGVGIRGGMWIVAGTVCAKIGEHGTDLGTGLAIAGVLAGTMLVVEISSIIDVAAADNSARDYNEKHGLTQISLSPTYDHKSKTPGFQMSMNF